MTYSKNLRCVVNCKHYSVHCCKHSDRPKFLWVFRRSCMEPGTTCDIKVPGVFHNPGVPTKAPPRVVHKIPIVLTAIDRRQEVSDD